MMGVADERVGEVLVEAVVVGVEATLFPVQVIDQRRPHLAHKLQIARPEKVPKKLIDVDLLHIVRPASVLGRMHGNVAATVDDRVVALPGQVRFGIGLGLSRGRLFVLHGRERAEMQGRAVVPAEFAAHVRPRANPSTACATPRRREHRPAGPKCRRPPSKGPEPRHSCTDRASRPARDRPRFLRRDSAAFRASGSVAYVSVLRGPLEACCAGRRSRAKYSGSPGRIARCPAITVSLAPLRRQQALGRTKPVGVGNLLARTGRHHADQQAGPCSRGNEVRSRPDRS